MDDLFKKFINTGVGFLSQGNKAVQAAIEKLVKESKLSEQEGKKIMDDLLKSGETKRADLEKQFKGLTEDLRSRVGRGADGQPTPTPPAKAKAAKPAAKAATTKKPATSATAQAAGTVKKAADKVSAAAGKAQRSAAAKAGAAKKAAPASANDNGAALDTK